MEYNRNQWQTRYSTKKAFRWRWCRSDTNKRKECFEALGMQVVHTLMQALERDNEVHRKKMGSTRDSEGPGFHSQLDSRFCFCKLYSLSKSYIKTTECWSTDCNKWPGASHSTGSFPDLQQFWNETVHTLHFVAAAIYVYYLKDISLVSKDFTSLLKSHDLI